MTKIDPDQVSVILATDCGSTTTKAILIQRVDGEFRQTHRGEAPTTVEKLSKALVSAEDALGSNRPHHWAVKVHHLRPKVIQRTRHLQYDQAWQGHVALGDLLTDPLDGRALRIGRLDRPGGLNRESMFELASQ